MTKKKTMCYVATNERGLRIGQDHPNAKLTDIEVDALLRDRGPEDAPQMSYLELAKKYGISKSGARYIVNGDRRGQARRYVKKEETKHSFADKKVRVKLTVSLRARAILHRIGGGRLIEKLAVHIDNQLRCAPEIDGDQAFARLMAKIWAMK